MKIKLILALLLLSQLSPAVTLEWDKSPDAWVSGYNIYAGTNSFYGTNGVALPLTNYVVKVNCGTNTLCTLSNLLSGTFYFVATAYVADNQESLPSNEVIYTVPKSPESPGSLRTVIIQYSTAINTTNWSDVGFFRVKIGL